MIFPRWKFLIAACLTAFCGPFQMSYHGGIINLPQDVFEQFINETNIERYGTPMDDTTLNVLWGWIVSIMSVGGLVGTLITPFVAEKFGRKMSLMVWSNVIVIASSVLMSFCQMAHSYEMLAVGRFISGFTQGVATTILPIYLSECSPISYRGFMGSIQNIFVNIVTVLAFVVALPMVWGNATWLPVLLGFGIVPAVVQMISAFFLPESPKYLYIYKKDPVRAEKALRFWTAEKEMTPADVKAAFHEFDEEAEVLSQEVGFLKAIRIPYFRRIFIVTSVILSCQAFTAVGPLFAYSTEMFLALGFSRDEADLCTNMLAVVNTFGAFVVSPFIDRYTRRAFFFSSYIVLTLSLTGYALLWVTYDATGWTWTAYIALACLFVYCIVYNMGAGMLSWILPAEMSPQAIRSTVTSVCYAVGWVWTIISTFIYPVIQDAMGPWSYFTYIVPLVISLAYLYKTMPETGGKTAAELVMENSPEKRSQSTEHQSNGGDSGFWAEAAIRDSQRSISKSRLPTAGPEYHAPENGIYIVDRNISVEKF